MAMSKKAIQPNASKVQAGLQQYNLETAKLDWETQKKSQHREAEKERRRHLTAALEQLSTVISEKCCALPSSSAIAKQPPKVTLAAWASNVRTVQLAIDYISCLQQHVRDLSRRLDTIERSTDADVSGIRATEQFIMM